MPDSLSNMGRLMSKLAKKYNLRQSFGALIGLGDQKFKVARAIEALDSQRLLLFLRQIA